MKAIIIAVFGLVLSAAVFFLLAESPTIRERILGQSQVRTIQINLTEAKMVHQTVYAENIITVDLQGEEELLFGIIRAKRLIIASGFCLAGIDYDKNPSQIQLYDDNPQRVGVQITKPEILNCGVTSVKYYDGSGLVTASTELSNRLHQAAVEKIRQQAEASDLIAKAEEKAKLEVELYLRRLGFETVNVTVKIHLF